MSHPPDPTDVAAALDSAWTGEGLHRLEELLHPDVVILGPDLTPRGSGRQACVDGYREFLERAEVESLTISDRHVHRTGDTAVVASRFRLTYRTEGQPVEETGSDVWVLVLGAEGWQATWRLLTSSEVR